ncbi:MAG TPA: twin-arginine translocase subunit TatC [Gammaproteobacteria bacterium]|nr:twin-arginine translocase subunit TatC [Gammaproteobacteria bacterium]
MEKQKTESRAELGFISHLIELRSRLLRCIVAILLVLLPLMPFANRIYSLLAAPLLRYLPSGSSMIATGVVAPFMIPFKLVTLLSVFIVVPYLLYQIWAFVAPGLYRHEKHFALPMLVSSILLFYTGVAFAYFLVLPMVLRFMIGIAPEGISVMPDIANYLDFAMAMFLAFGFAFEIPVATVLLASTGLISVATMVAARPYVIVGAFVVGMLLTPPDVISQTMLAIPMWFLYEAGIIASRAILKRRVETVGKKEVS